jgi:hypothetical protein
MSLRYHARPFAEADAKDPQSLLEEIGRIARNAYTGPSDQWAEIIGHLHELGVRTLLIQERVRDPDFTAEYEAFYAKQQRDMSRFCVRVHAFRAPVARLSTDPTEVLQFIDDASAQADSYLGFVTLRPLRHAPIGATILVDDPRRRSLCRDRFPVHIAGTTFQVEGTPYLQQENAVAACAQASIWMALRTLRKRFGSSAYSPAELTVAATRYMAVDRVFPGRRGLRVEQMLSAIQESDHDPLVIPVRAKQDVPPNPYEVMETVQPYLESGLPVVMLLEHSSGGHAVVAIGLASGTPMSHLPPGLIIHNDNQGPYRVLPYSPHDKGYALNQCMTVIVPLPRGISMSAKEASKRSGELFGVWLRAFVKDPAVVTLNDDLWTRTYLCTRHSFRAWAKSDTGLDAAAAKLYRTSEMPQYVWVTEFHDARQFDPLQPQNRTRIGEIVLDAGADVFHGDDLVFLRLARQMVKEETLFPGLLFIGDRGGSVPLGSAELTVGIAAPWDHL